LFRPGASASAISRSSCAGLFFSAWWTLGFDPPLVSWIVGNISSRTTCGLPSMFTNSVPRLENCQTMRRRHFFSPSRRIMIDVGAPDRLVYPSRVTRARIVAPCFRDRGGQVRDGHGCAPVFCGLWLRNVC
jgi:hypothetical protein